MIHGFGSGKARALPAATCAVLALLVLPLAASAQEPEIKTTVIDSDRDVAEDIRVAPGEVLRIMPGVTLRFAQGAGIRTEGRVEAVGLAEKPVVFTASDPALGWANVSLEGPGALNSRFERCRFELGRGRTYRFDEKLHLVGIAEGDGKGLGCGGALFFYMVRSALVDSCVFEGNRSGWSGGAVTCWSGSCPLIRRCLFVDNEAGEDGGAIHCVLGSAPAIMANSMARNRAQYGGAIHCLHMSPPVIAWNDIRENTATRSAGAVSCFNECVPVLIGNRITGNSSPGEGALNAARKSSPRLTGNFILANESGEGKEQLPSHVSDMAPAGEEDVARKLAEEGAPAIPETVKRDESKKGESEEDGF